MRVKIIRDGTSVKSEKNTVIHRYQRIKTSIKILIKNFTHTHTSTIDNYIGIWHQT